MAVTPAPPGLFSTYTLWPSCLVSSAATERATISLVPPGANGTTKRTGFVGQVDCAKTEGAATSAAETESARSWRRLSVMRVPLSIDESLCGD
jgi:hypothetical protein